MRGFFQILWVTSFNLLFPNFLLAGEQPQNCLPLMGGAYIPEPIPFPVGGIVTGNGISFTSDGCTLYITQKPGEVAQIFKTHFDGKTWSAPKVIEILDLAQDTYQPRLSPNGKRLYFNSSRPMPNGKFHPRLRKLWVSDWQGNGWGEPSYAEINTTDPFIKSNYPAPVADGSLYFRSTRSSSPTDETGINNANVHLSRFKDGVFQPPVLIKEVSEGDVVDVFVTPDEKIMVITNWDPTEKEPIIHISFWNKASWTPPRKIEELDLPGWELTPTISPDGLYILFEKKGIIQIVSLEAVLTEKEMEFLK